jgi:hypothetical protein
MKSKFYLALLATILISSLSSRTNILFAEDTEHTPCLILYEEYLAKKYHISVDEVVQDTSIFYNPYKVMVDTCGGYNPEYLRYMTHYFEVEFKKNIIPRDTIYEDNRLIYYTIDDILPQYEECIEGFKKMEVKFGKFKFVDRNTKRRDTTTSFPNRKLSIIFENYVQEAMYYWNWDFGIDEIDIGGVCVNGLSGKYFYEGVIINNTISADNLLIKPNIAINQITIILSEEDIQLPKAINIFDSTGTQVKIQYTGLYTEHNIDISNLPIGRYTIQLGSKIGHFIITR